MQGIIINITDHPTLGVKRKVEVKGYSQNWEEEFIKVIVVCHHYNNNNGEYGNLIHTQSLKSFERIFLAKNNIKVDSTDGMELYSEETTIENEDGEMISEVVYKRYDNNQIVINPINQFDYFDYVIKNVPILIPQLITSVIQIEDVLKKNFDS